MLTKGQQYIVLQLYNVFKNEEDLFRAQRNYLSSDEQDVYTNKNTFYASINYLIKAGFVKKRKEGKVNLYWLTLEGEILAMLLRNLPDLPNDFKEG